MDAPTTSNANLWHIAWTVVLTIFAIMLRWTTGRISKEIDSKADRTELAQLRNSMEDWRRERRSRDEQQDRMHEENRARLDRILERLPAKSR